MNSLQKVHESFRKDPDTVELRFDHFEALRKVIEKQAFNLKMMVYENDSLHKEHRGSCSSALVKEYIQKKRRYIIDCAVYSVFGVNISPLLFYDFYLLDRVYYQEYNESQGSKTQRRQNIKQNILNNVLKDLYFLYYYPVREPATIYHKYHSPGYIPWTQVYTKLGASKDALGGSTEIQNKFDPLLIRLGASKDALGGSTEIQNKFDPLLIRYEATKNEISQLSALINSAYDELHNTAGVISLEKYFMPLARRLVKIDGY